MMQLTDCPPGPPDASLSHPSGSGAPQPLGTMVWNCRTSRALRLAQAWFYLRMCSDWLPDFTSLPPVGPVGSLELRRRASLRATANASCSNGARHCSGKDPSNSRNWTEFGLFGLLGLFGLTPDIVEPIFFFFIFTPLFSYIFLGQVSSLWERTRRGGPDIAGSRSKRSFIFEAEYAVRHWELWSLWLIWKKLFDPFCIISMPSLDLGVSENSVPLNPMVNDHYPY